MNNNQPQQAVTDERPAWMETPCEPWAGHITAQGYGRVSVKGRSIGAHVLAWTTANGPVPKGLVLDHLCRNRACCNVKHLEPVTPKENTLRGIGPTAQNAKKTHCKRGHELSGSNVIGTEDGWRICHTCQRLHDQAYKQKTAVGPEKAYRNNKKSGLRGVYQRGNRWQAQIRANSKAITLGTFATKEEAHAAYRAAAERLFGKGSNAGGNP